MSSSYHSNKKHRLIFLLIAIVAVAILIQGPGHIFSTAEREMSPQRPFPFLFGPSSLPSDCPQISVDEIASNRPNYSIAKYYDERRPPERAIDTDENTKWTSKGNDSSLTVQLGSSSRICDLGIAWYLGNNRSYNFAVAISENGSNFVNVYTNRSSGTTNSTEIYHLPDVNATAIRLIVNGSNINHYAHVSDLKLYGYTMPSVE